jgi:hypothetical protein
MIREAIKITVVLENGHKLQKIETVETDGAYRSVNLEASKIVGKNFSGQKVSDFFWQYV